MWPILDAVCNLDGVEDPTAASAYLFADLEDFEPEGEAAEACRSLMAGLRVERVGGGDAGHSAADAASDISTSQARWMAQQWRVRREGRGWARLEPS